MSTKAEQFLEQIKAEYEKFKNFVNKADFENFIKSLMQAFLKREKKFDDKFAATLEELKKEIDNFTLGSERDLESLKEKFTGLIEKALSEQENALNFVRDKVWDIPAGKDGERGEQGPIGPVGPQGPPGSPDTPEMVRDKLETLEGEERLDKSAIKGLEELIKSLEEKISKNVRVGGGGFSYIAMDQHFIDDETPDEVPNGVITEFTVKHTPSPATSLKVFNDGQRQKLGATKDYTFSANKVTYNTAPLAGVIITFDYRI